MSFASADTTHVIGKGHTLEAIANRYHVTQKAIIDANKIGNVKHLMPGDTLIIPGVGGTAKKPVKPGTQVASTQVPDVKGGRRGPVAVEAPPKPVVLPPQRPVNFKEETPPPSKVPHTKYEATPKHPNVVHFVRTGEEFKIRVKDQRGKIPPPALRSFEKMMRSGNAVRSVDPRLIALLGIVSNHFGGRKVEVVSGFRPYTPTQYTPHSNHNFGRAIDFRIEGVPNDALRDFCKTLRNVGVGYYPNSTFVHLDVRESPAFWIDYSRPGEAPRYNSPNVKADEGTSDVPEDAHAADPPGNVAPPPAPEPAGDKPEAPAPPSEAGR